MKKFIFGLVSGLIIASSVTVIASSGRNITVFDDVNKIVVDKVEKPFDKSNAPFVYNGTTYVPLRFVADALGEAVSWDGKTGTVFIGKTDNKDVDHWDEDIKHMNMQDWSGTECEYSYNQKDITVTSNIGETYSNFLKISLCVSPYGDTRQYQLIEFPLKGKYKEFVSSIGMTDKYKSSSALLDVNIYVDGKKVETLTLKNGDMPKDLKVNIVGANKIGFEVIENEENEGSGSIQVVFFDGEFIK